MKEKKNLLKNFCKNIPFLISGIAVAVLNAISLSRIVLAVIMLVVLVIISMQRNNIYTYWKSHISFLSLFISLCLLVLFRYSFCSSMTDGSKLLSIFPFIGGNVKVIAFFCSIVGIYFLSTVVSALYSGLVFDTQMKNDLYISDQYKANVSKREFVFIIITAVTAITICSKSSPIYPFNDWVDSNCYMTVGKSMLHDVVPYRDLYEHKGPLLYMLHALAAIISENTFTGVYVLEIIAATVFLFYSYKLMKLYQQSDCIILIPVLAALVYSSESFCHGDSAEEFCLPLFAFAIYLVFQYIKLGKCPTRTECIAIGVTSAFVLWIKFSMLGFYLGWFCVIAWQQIRYREIKKLFHITLWIGIGVLIPTIPILIYFSMNHALSDLWTVYFYNNLFYYTTLSDDFMIVSLAKNLLGGMIRTFIVNPISVALIGIGMLALVKKSEKTQFVSYLIMGMFTFLFVYIGGQNYTYYSLIFSSFIPIGLLAVSQTLQYHLFAGYQKSKKPKVSKVFHVMHRFWAGIICAGCLIFSFTMCNNTYLLRYKKSDLPQYQFAKIIAQKKDATLLNYGFLDGGFYTTTGIIPNCKFFCSVNIALDEMTEMQNEFVNKGQVDFVITRNSELESERYECIATSTFYFEGSEWEYFLYQLIH